MGFIDNLLNAIRNKYLNATGAERDLLTLIKDKDITQAQTLMQNRDTEVLQAIQEYNPELHRIMRKADKMRKGQEPYRTEKLPRARQKYINEVELFFLLGNPIRWKKVNNEGSDEAFEAYNQFLQDTRFNVSMRKAKRIAGAETECAKLYHIYRDENFQPHKIMVPFNLDGQFTVKSVVAEGEYKILDKIAVIVDADGNEKDITMVQKWPVKKAINVHAETASLSRTKSSGRKP